MTRRFMLVTAVGAMFIFTTMLSLRVMAASAQGASDESWTIPPTAAAEKNPVEANPQVLKKGLQIYNSKCERCHGSNGKGDGPDGEADHPPADLTDAERAAKNPDGIMFYKIWNGRTKPKMPAFKTELSRTDVWTVVQFVKTFRQ
jgi:mono/diheme cytochrome c family protein